MAKRRNSGYVLCILLMCALPVWGQVLPLPTVEPVPLPGGDILPPLFNQFFPGVGPLFDGLNADPHGITNFRGVAAMGYTNGLATDNANNAYQVITDIRVYPNWAGEMWTATNSGTFSVAYNDKSFLAQGTFSSDFLPAGNFGEMGTERNGSFVEREDAENDAEVNTQEGQTQKAQVSAKATTSDPVGAAETIMALRSSRAKALRALKSKL